MKTFDEILGIIIGTLMADFPNETPSSILEKFYSEDETVSDEVYEQLFYFLADREFWCNNSWHI